MHDEREQAELIKRQRDANKAYSVSNELGGETESQVEAVFFTDEAKPKMQSSYDGECWKNTYEPSARYHRIYVPPPEYNEPPPLTRHDEECFRYFVWGCIAGPIALALVAGMAWLAVKGIDAGFWWMGQFLGAR